MRLTANQIYSRLLEIEDDRLRRYGADKLKRLAIDMSNQPTHLSWAMLIR